MVKSKIYLKESSWDGDDSSMKEQQRQYTDWKMVGSLFWTFFKIGPVTFGGGYSMIPLFEREIVENKKWIPEQDAADLFALAQTVPGAIGINSAAIVGYRLAGVKGAVSAMLGIVLPTFLLVIALSIAILQIRDNPKIEAAFKGIQAAVVAMIAYAGFKMGRSAIFDRFTLIALLVTLALLLGTSIHPVVVIAGGAAIGIAAIRIKQKLGLVWATDRKPPAEGKYEDYFFGDGI